LTGDPRRSDDSTALGGAAKSTLGAKPS